MSTTFHACSFCGDELAVDDTLKSTLPMLAGALIVAHQSVCEDYLELAGDVLVSQIEAHLEKHGDRCPYLRVVDGKTFRCKHTVGQCGGNHFMIRAGETT